MSDNQDLLSEVDHRRLDVAYWWLTHKYQLKQTRTIILLAVDLLFLLFLLYTFMQLTFSMQETRNIQLQIQQNDVNFGYYRTIFGAKEPSVSATTALRLDAKTVLLLVKVTNPNTYWGTDHLVIDVSAGGTRIGSVEGFMLPKEERYFMAEVEYEDTDTELSSVTSKMSTWLWRRVPDPDSFPEPNFVITEPTLDIATAEVPAAPGKKSTETKQFHRVQTTVRTGSIYGYKNVDVIGILFQGDTPVAAKETTIAEIAIGEEKKVELLWPKVYSGATRSKVYASANVFRDINLLLPVDTDIPGEF